MTHFKDWGEVLEKCECGKPATKSIQYIARTYEWEDGWEDVDEDECADSEYYCDECWEDRGKEEPK